MFKTLLAIIGGVTLLYQAAKAWDKHCQRKYKAEAYDAAQAARTTPPAPTPPPFNAGA